MEAGKQQLIAAYNQHAGAVRSLQATVEMVPSTGSTYSGVIEQYREVPGFILAQRPASVRVIGQAPVVAKNIFDMVSDGDVFRIFIPSKNVFLVGATSVARASKKPIENLRPQHVVEALFWPEMPAETTVLFEQFDADPARYYVLTVLRHEGSSPEIARKIWFDRADLRVARLQAYGPSGRLDSDMTYSNWQPAGQAAAGTADPATLFPRNIVIWRPQDDYKLEVHITKLSLNQPITADHFELKQPAGAELVQVNEEASGAQR
jgi:outer membrane lipoprotein-sorting protein